MPNTDKTSGPAFPSVYDSAYEGTIDFVPGITKRQYYKAKLAPTVYAEHIGHNVVDFAKIAKEVGQLADALLAEDEEFDKRNSEITPADIAEALERR